MKDPSTKTDPVLLDTIKWLGKEAKSLLEELMEMNVVKGDISMEINNIEKNRKVIQDMLGEGKTKFLVRVPVQALEEIDKDNAQRFFGALKTAANCFVEIYSAEGTADINEEYRTFQKLPPEGFIKTRGNTITLFMPPADRELTPGVLQGRMGEVGLQPVQTILCPVNLRNDPAGLVSSILMGFRLMSIARNKDDTDFVNETKRLYNLTDDDVSSLTAGDINSVIKTLRKLIKLMPIKRYDTSDIEKVYKHAEEVILTAA